MSSYDSNDKDKVMAVDDGYGQEDISHNQQPLEKVSEQQSDEDSDDNEGKEDEDSSGLSYEEDEEEEQQSAPGTGRIKVIGEFGKETDKKQLSYYLSRQEKQAKINQTFDPDNDNSARFQRPSPKQASDYNLQRHKTQSIKQKSSQQQDSLLLMDAGRKGGGDKAHTENSMVQGSDRDSELTSLRVEIRKQMDELKLANIEIKKKKRAERQRQRDQRNNETFWQALGRIFTFDCGSE